MRKLFGPIVLLLLSITFHWRIALTDQFTWLDSSDLVNMVLPRFQFMAGEWRHSRFPLWDPHQWNGQPFLAQWTGAAMPLNWPLFVFGGFHEGKIRFDVMNWYFILVHWLGAVFTYALCRDVGRSRGAAILAGVVFAFGGYFGNTDWPEVFTGCVWIPLVYLYLLRAARGERPLASAAMSGLFCGMSWLAGHHQAPFYLTVSVIFVWLGISISRRDIWALRHAVITVLFAILVGGLQIVPGQEYGKLAIRWAGAPNPLGWRDIVPYAVHVNYSLQPPDLFGIVLPHMGGHAPTLAGVVVLIAIAAALHGVWHELAVRVFLGVAIGGLLFSLAEFNVFYGVLYALFPGFEKARVPARTAMLWSFAVAPLAAYGIDWLREIDRSRWIQWAVRAGALMFAAAFALLAAGKPDYVARLEGAGIFLLGTAGLLAGGGRWMVPGLIALSMIELYQNRIFLPWPNPDGLLARLGDHKEIAAFLKKQPRPFRVEVSEEIQYNFGDWHQLDSFGGFGAGVTENILRTDWPGDNTRRMLGITYLVAKKPSRGDQQEVFAASNGWKVYRNTNALSRAWVVHEATRLADNAKIRDAIMNGADISRAAFMTAVPPPLEKCEGPEEIAWREIRAARIRFEVDAKCAGLVVVSDTWYPGWTATVDGKPAPILEVNGALRGVVVAGGKHTVEMRFRGWAFYAGFLMTLTGVALALRLNLKRPVSGGHGR